MSLKYHQLDSSVEKQIKENISKGILSPYRFMDENAEIGRASCRERV